MKLQFKEQNFQVEAVAAIVKCFDGYMAAFFRQVKIGVLTLTLEKKQ